jgi:hypothetical protein
VAAAGVNVVAAAGRAADKAAAVVVVSAAVAVVAWVEAAAKAEIARRVAPIEAPQFGAPFFVSSSRAWRSTHNFAACR